MPPIIWIEPFTVRVFEIDARGTLGVRSLCDYLQEAAGNHAREFGGGVNTLQDRGMTWVLSRIRVRISRLPRAGEKLAVRTWHSGFDRLFSLRDFSLVDAEDNPIVTAVSAWVMLDLRARRPVRPSTVFSPPDPSGIPRAFAADLEKLPGCAGDGKETSISVRWSDLDVNGHVNNSRYAEWVAEGASAVCHDGERLAGLDIDYLAETLYPDSVVVRSRRDQGGAGRVDHAIARASDRVEAVHARTEWTLP
ncbi:MAG: acyl-[acyl-carrier-protein] thioesterase [Spirochaetia bacterium]